MNNPHISVIIPAKNASNTLETCLRAVMNQEDYVFGRDYEIIVVDDGSDDDTRIIAQLMNVIAIHQQNAGPASARNRGAQAAVGELLLFTDADCQPEPDWIRQMILPFHNLEVVGVKGTYTCTERNPVARFVQLEFEYKYRALAKLDRIDFIDTYSAAYRRDIFLKNGGFDERFPVPSVEDQELSFRLARLGYQLVFQPTAKVRHSHDLTLGEYARRKWGIGYWKAFLLKWLPEKGFGDTYTPVSQKMQIGLMALSSLLLIALVFNLISYWIFLASIGLFFISGLSYLTFVVEQDAPIFWMAGILLPLRAASIGFGLLSGLLFSPRISPEDHPVMNGWELLIKRLLDVFGSVMGLLLFWPVILFSAIAVVLDSPGPPFFTHWRAGRNGIPFKLIKIRTMYVSAEDKFIDHQLQNEPGNHSHSTKKQNDPRITRVGRFLRRWSLDELPQFWNIFRGEMSLVGPRPEEMRIVANYALAERERLIIRPGLTGPMQVAGRADLDFNQRLAYEMEYIHNYSLLKDVAILLKSIRVVLNGKGAY